MDCVEGLSEMNVRKANHGGQYEAHYLLWCEVHLVKGQI